MSTKNSTYLLICGLNNCKQFEEEPNNNAFGYPIINPPIKSQLAISTLSSYCIYKYHSVWVTLDGKAYAVGLNSDHRIIDSLKHIKNQKYEEVQIKDINKVQYEIISAVCGEWYTLYLVSPPSGPKKLAFVYSGENRGKPLFVNIKGPEPIALFGGHKNSAAIDAEGGIITLTSSLFKTPNSEVKSTFLPGHEKAVSVACCENFFIALSENGRIYESGNKQIEFRAVSKFSKEKIIDISGKYEHCIAVCSDGKVFVRGLNKYGELGLGQDVEEVKEFKEIMALKKYKISTASAGGYYSLFQTEKGMILACGQNLRSELLLDNFGGQVYLPVETLVKNGASLCIAGGSSSAVFIGDQIPPNIPNRKVCFNKGSKPSTTKTSSILDSSSKSSKTDAQAKVDAKSDLKELETLKKSVEEKDIEIKKLQESVQKLTKENKKQKSDISKLETTIKELKEQTSKNGDGIQNKESKHKEIDFLEATDLAHLKNRKKIGQGATSTVFKVTQEENYALKVLNTEICHKEGEEVKNGFSDSDNDDEDSTNEVSIDFDKMRRFFAEYEVINQLNHPHIIRTFGFFIGDASNSPSILLEYCPHSLKSGIKFLSESDRCRVIVETCEAMKEVHKAGLIHRDLKPENILLDRKKSVKVSDFGLCTLITLDTETTTRTQMAGTIQFMAPEILQGRTDYNEKVDVYAFGVVVFFTTTGGEYPKFNLTDVVNGKRVKIPSTLTDFTQKVLNQCLSPKAKDRPSFEELYESLKENQSKLI